MKRSRHLVEFFLLEQFSYKFKFIRMMKLMLAGLAPTFLIFKDEIQNKPASVIAGIDLGGNCLFNPKHLNVAQRICSQ